MGQERQVREAFTGNLHAFFASNLISNTRTRWAFFCGRGQFCVAAVSNVNVARALAKWAVLGVSRGRRVLFYKYHWTSGCRAVCVCVCRNVWVSVDFASVINTAKRPQKSAKASPTK